MTLTPPVGQPATLHFGDGEFVVLRPGDHVVCAVSGRRIPLTALRYWSAERQEAYAGPSEFLSRASDAA
ncbi:MAG: DUF2093 domain-containing protein [Brevundimonas sp.]|uniref:DUF2093 domain-containing protein n=1 Tax=Brevundimonas sp. TaxID=1871086 RepID=UPI004033DAA0